MGKPGMETGIGKDGIEVGLEFIFRDVIFNTILKQFKIEQVLPGPWRSISL